MYTYRGEVKSVVDAKTIWMNIDFGFNFHSLQLLTIYGIDTPSALTEAGKIAKEYVKSVLLGDDAFKYVYVRTIKDRKDKYGRKLAVLYFDEKSMVFDHNETKIEMMPDSFNKQIVRNGHAIERYW